MWGVVCVVKSKQTVHRKPRRHRRTQKGGLLPLAALIPALVAAGRAAALGGISGATGLEAASRKGQRWKINLKARKKLNGEAEHGLDVNRKDNVEVHCLQFLRTRPRSGTSFKGTKGIREWVQSVSPAVTTDVLHLGKYDSITKTATFLGGYS